MKSELLRTLEILAYLQAGDVSAADLCYLSECSIATLKRRISDARCIGAEVESVKIGSSWVYQLVNEPVIAVRLAKWLKLEREQSLI